MSQMPGPEGKVASPPQRGWFSRNMFWIIPVGVVLFLVLAIIVTPILCCSGGAFFAFNAVKKPVVEATDALNNDSRVTDKLGSPIKYESIGINNFQNNNGNGGADVDFPVRGPNGTARVTGRMNLNNGNWSVGNLTVELPDGTKIELPE